MVQGPSWEADSRPAGKETSPPLMELANIYYRGSQEPAALSQFNQVHAFLLSFFKIRFNIPWSVPVSSKRYIFFWFSN